MVIYHTRFGDNEVTDRSRFSFSFQACIRKERETGDEAPWTRRGQGWAHVLSEGWEHALNDEVRRDILSLNGVGTGVGGRKE